MLRKVSRSFVILAAAALAACASTASQPAHEPTLASKVVRATLDNGLRVIIVRDAFAPVATQQMTYSVGGNQALEGFPGMAHAQEHMMFRGAPGLTGDQLAGIYARLGGDMNAFTTNDITSYYFTVPADDIDVTLHVGAIRMRGVDDTQAGWKKERGAIEQEVARDHSQPFYALYEKLLKRMFGGTPYATDALGTKASFDKLTGPMLKKFHDTWYAPNNALLVVTGDVDPQAVLKRVKQLYGDIPRQNLPPRQPISFKPVKAATYTSKTDEPYGFVLVAFRMPGYSSPDYPAAEMAAAALGSQRGPIAALRYQGKALAAGFQMRTMPDTGLGFAYAIFPPGGNAKALKQALTGAIRQVRDKGINPDLITAAKRSALLDQALQKNSIHGLAMAWTQAVAIAGLDSPQQAVKQLRAVDVKAVNQFVVNSLDLDHAVTLILNPTPGAKPKMGKGAGGPESFGGKPSGPVALPQWAQKAFAQLPHPQPFLHPTDTTLANGMRLIVQPLEGSDTISVFGAVHQNEDLQAPNGEEGVAGVLGNLFDWGPEGMNRLQFDAASDAIGANMSVGASFSLQVLPQYFDQGMKLLSRAELNPSLPARAFKTQQFIQARAAQGALASPKYRFQRAVSKALLPPNDPALRQATGKTVMALTLDKVKAYYNKVYRPDETTIVVMGAVTPAKAKAVVEKYFGAWHASGPKPALAYPPVPPSNPTSVLVPDSLRKQNLVVIGETLPLTLDDPDHFALDLANDLLGGGFYASPLYKVLREKHGLVYSLASRFSFSRHRGIYSLQFGAYPQKVDNARQLAIKVLDRAAAHPMSDEQLHLAKSIGLRQIELGMQSVSAIGRGWIGYSENGLPLDYDYLMARHFEQLTAPEIQKAMKQYLDTSRLSIIQLGTQGSK
ncbi:MAG TPA: pitrilysin family protein [Gammaproteobacteria bacterium]|nr:pitrilysin family protein [Gammaproteobacteria bacterium]